MRLKMAVKGLSNAYFCMFQFLIGTLKTKRVVKDVSISTIVSIPHRHAKNLVETLKEKPASDGFNSS